MRTQQFAPDISSGRTPVNPSENDAVNGIGVSAEKTKEL
jgi:hypothetical protein